MLRLRQNSRVRVFAESIFMRVDRFYLFRIRIPLRWDVSPAIRFFVAQRGIQLHIVGNLSKAVANCTSPEALLCEVTVAIGVAH